MSNILQMASTSYPQESAIPNASSNMTDITSPTSISYSWGVLALTPLILASAVGNVLVCLAVCWDRKLQNMTNYFLMSLAMADLLVSLVVMPLAMIVEFYGYFPLQPSVCVFWATMDVFLCTASIWHMCTMSMDRFCTLKYPMRYGRNKTKTMVVVKITFVWLVSISICSPLCVMGYSDHSSVFSEGRCAPTIRSFVIYGSIFAFYVPLLIMVVTYILTIQILCTNQKIMKHVAREHTSLIRARKTAGPAVMTTSLGAFLTPFTPRFTDRSSFDTSISNNVSINDSVMQSNSENGILSEMPQEHLDKRECPHTEERHECPAEMQVIPKVALLQDTPSQNSMNTGNTDSCRNSSTCVLINNFTKRSALSTSQPHLPSMSSRFQDRPSLSHHSLCYISQAKSHLTVHDLESVRNYSFVSAATSLNSMLSRENWGSEVWSEFEDPEMFEKLSQIEAEMDECLMDSQDCDNDGDQTANETTSLLSVFTETASPFPGCSSGAMKAPPVFISPGTPVPRSGSREVCSNGTSLSSSGNDSKSRSISESDQSGFITIQLKPSGCYLYKIDYSKSSSTNGAKRYECVEPKKSPNSPNQSANNINGFFEYDTGATNQNNLSADETQSDIISTTTCSTVRKYSPHIGKRYGSTRAYSASAWKAFLHRKQRMKNKTRANGHVKQVISKRTATNERKASKVLGIIFAVFVTLWTPFFIVNVLSVVCEVCMEQLTPAMLAAIVWLGYLSSLANPIIYTMFNTAFRNAFVKILTCRQFYHIEASYRTSTRAKTPDSLHMTNMTSAFNQTPNQNRRTLNNSHFSPSLRK